MKRIKKYNRFASIILILSLLMVTFAGCKKIDKNTTKDNDGLVTRGAWISWLGETFGMDTYDNATSYYNDIKSDNPIFNYVQSCYEWGVLSKGAKAFKPDDKASLGFIVSTAVLAAELDYSGYKGDSDNEKIINCAADFALCEGLKYDTEILNASVDELSAALILKAAQQAYLNKPYEEHEDVVMNPEVVDLKETEITVTNQETGDCVLSGEVASTLSVGKVFIEPASAEFPCGRAVKVVSITTNEDGTCTVITEEPELGEVFEKIDIEKEIDTVTPEMVKCVEGVELVDIETASNNANMAQLAYVVPNSKIDVL